MEYIENVKCNQNLFMEHSNQQCFTKNKIYTVQYRWTNAIGLIDDQNYEHHIPGDNENNNWLKYFITYNKSIKIPKQEIPFKLKKNVKKIML